jgi:CheY-like chemotaxis protein
MKPEKRNSRKGSVLVVDDEEIMREVLETLLTAEGYRVDLAKTGEEGLEAYGRRAFDVVLLDVSMPGIGGLRALEEFLKMDPDAVIVMITAYATFRHRHRCVGTRRVRLHSQALSERTDHRDDRRRH